MNFRAIGLVVMIAMGLFPPLKIQDLVLTPAFDNFGNALPEQRYYERIQTVYGPLWTDGTIAIGRLLVQWVVVALAVLLLEQVPPRKTFAAPLIAGGGSAAGRDGGDVAADRLAGVGTEEGIIFRRDGLLH